MSVNLNVDVTQQTLELTVEQEENTFVIEVDNRFTATWSTILGKPVSNVNDIDDAVTNSHTHTNKTILDALADNAGVLAYNGTDVVFDGDIRLTDSREWTADIVSQAEAEAGTATTRRAWTAERVKQAIDANAAGSGSDNNANILIWQGI